MGATVGAAAGALVGAAVRAAVGTDVEAAAGAVVGKPPLPVSKQSGIMSPIYLRTRSPKITTSRWF